MTATLSNDRHPQQWGEDEYLPDLLISASKTAGVVELQQSTGNGEYTTVEIHASQVLYIAQRLGMVRELTGDEAAAREALQVRIRVLERDLARMWEAVDLAAHRAKALYDNICLSDDKGHEDLGIEVVQALALWELLELVNKDGVTAPATLQQRPCNATGNAPATSAQRSANAASVTPPPAPGTKGGDLFGGGQP